MFRTVSRLWTRLTRSSRPGVLSRGRTRGILLERLEDRATPTVSALAPEFLVNTTTASDQFTDQAANRPVARNAAGDFVVVWESFDEVGDNNYDIYARRYDAQGNARDTHEFLVNTTTAGAQQTASVAIDADGNFVVVWASIGHPGGDSFDVYARRFGADGAALDAHEFLVSTTTVGGQLTASVAMDADGNFIVAWADDKQSDGAVSDIYARRFGADSAALDLQEFLVNGTAGSDHRFPSVAASADGDFVVTWASLDPAVGGSSWDVYARRYTAAGSSPDGEFRVNTTTANAQQWAEAAMDPAGNFVVVWEGNNQLGGGLTDIYARRYDAQGNARDTNEFLVNTITTGTQASPSVTVDAAGDFAVVWMGINQGGGGSGWDVYVRAYDAQGTVPDPEVRVNTTLASDQQFPSAAMDRDGNFVVTWASLGTGFVYDVYGRLYSGGFNLPPVADAAGPYAVAEGGSVTLSGAGSSDPNQTTESLTFAWDLDGDGQYDDATGISPVFSAVGLDGPTSRTVGLKVTDNAGAFSTATATVNVTNVNPTATLSNNGPVTFGQDATVSFGGQFDPSPADVTAGFHYAYAVDSPAALDAATYGNSGSESSQSFSLDAGVHTVYARIIDKDGGFTQYSTQVTVHKATPTVTVVPVSVTYDGAAHGTTGVVTGVGGVSLGAAVISYSSGSAPVNAGSYTATGSFAGNDNYFAATGTAAIDIVRATSTTTVTGGSFTYDGAGHGATSASVTGAGGLSTSPTLTYKDSAGNVIAGLPTNAGSYTVVASYAGDANHTGSSASAAITIARATPTVTVVDASFTFEEGQAHPATGSVTGVGGVSLGTPTFAYSYVDDNGNVVTLTGAPVDPGEYTVTASFAGNANYNPAQATGTIVIAYEAKSLFDLSRVFNLGRTIPIKIRLLDANGNNVSSPSIDLTALRLERVNADGSVTRVTLDDAGNSNPGNLFRYDYRLRAYVFNLNTRGLSAGTYNFYWMAEDDPTEHKLTFRLGGCH